MLEDILRHYVEVLHEFIIICSCMLFYSVAKSCFFEKEAQQGHPIKFFIPNVDVDLPLVAGDVYTKFGENRSSRFDLYK